MAKFCGKCGAKLDETTGLCPNCAPREEPKKEELKKEAPRKASPQKEGPKTEKKARKRFNELKSNLKCGWVDLVAEEEEEGGYMNIIDSYDNRFAAMVTSLTI